MLINCLRLLRESNECKPTFTRNLRSIRAESALQKKSTYARNSVEPLCTGPCGQKLIALNAWKIASFQTVCVIKFRISEIECLTKSNTYDLDLVRKKHLNATGQRLNPMTLS